LLTNNTRLVRYHSARCRDRFIRVVLPFRFCDPGRWRN